MVLKLAGNPVGILPFAEIPTPRRRSINNGYDTGEFICKRHVIQNDTINVRICSGENETNAEWQSTGRHQVDAHNT